MMSCLNVAALLQVLSFHVNVLQIKDDTYWQQQNWIYCQNNDFDNIMHRFNRERHPHRCINRIDLDCLIGINKLRNCTYHDKRNYRKVTDVLDDHILHYSIIMMFIIIVNCGFKINSMISTIFWVIDTKKEKNAAREIERI